MNPVPGVETPSSQEERIARENLRQALYKTGYCICIPDYKKIDRNRRQASSNWLQWLLLQKNLDGDSILVRLFNLALRNHTLTPEQFSHLFHLIYHLLKQLHPKQIGDLLNEVHYDQLPVIYNFLYRLSLTRHLNRTEYQRHQLWNRNSNCLNSLRYFLYWADPVSLDRFVGNSTYSSFLLLKQLLHQISNPSTSKPCLNLFILTAEKMIDHFPQPNFDKRLQEQGEQEVSVLCEQLFKGLRLFIQKLVRDEKKYPFLPG